MSCYSSHRKNTYIVGAGFTKSVFQDAPLNDDLMTLLAHTPGSVSCVIMDKYGTKDIEIALTKLYLDMTSSCGEEKEKLQNYLKEIKKEIGDHFSLYRAAPELVEQLPWLRKFMQSTIKNGDVVISLNYDCVFEGALDCVGRWSLNGGYGSTLDNPFADGEKSPIAVLKIHGSVTFKCAPYANKPSCKAIGSIINENYFPLSGKNTHFGYGLGKAETYLLEPSFVKIPLIEIVYVMIDALKAVSESKNLIILGCSLRTEDNFLKLLITHFLRHPDWQHKKIIIIDIKANEIASKIKEYYAVNIHKCIIPLEGLISEHVDKLGSLIAIVKKKVIHPPGK